MTLSACEQVVELEQELARLREKVSEGADEREQLSRNSAAEREQMVSSCFLSSSSLLHFLAYSNHDNDLFGYHQYVCIVYAFGIIQLASKVFSINVYK